jgi:hypothetical protein
MKQLNPAQKAYLRDERGDLSTTVFCRSLGRIRPLSLLSAGDVTETIPGRLDGHRINDK